MCTRYDCIYHAGDDSAGDCDYLLCTHHARILICPPGDECTVYVKGKRIVRRHELLDDGRIPVKDQPQADISMLRELHSQGLTDAQIAEKLHRGKSYVCRWRNRIGLRPNSEHDYSRYEELYQLGMSDHEIAEKLGIKPKTVAQWRYTKEYPPHKPMKKGRPRNEEN